MMQASTLAYFTDAADRWFRGQDPRVGSFVASLFDTCGKADAANLAKLREAFPNEVGAWIARRDA